jgi:hypothetical protein
MHSRLLHHYVPRFRNHYLIAHLVTVPLMMMPEYFQAVAWVSKTEVLINRITRTPQASCLAGESVWHTDSRAVTSHSDTRSVPQN